MKILSIIGLVLLGAFLGVSLMINVAFLSGSELLSSVKESSKKVEVVDKKAEEAKEKLTVHSITKKYNNLVSRYNRSLELLKRKETSINNYEIQIKDLKTKLRKKPKIKYEKEYITKEVEVCKNPEVVKPIPVQKHIPEYKAEASGALVINSVEEVEDTSRYAVVEPIPVVEAPRTIYTRETPVVEKKVEIVHLPNDEKITELKKEEDCIIRYKRKLAKICLKRTNKAVEILTKTRTFRGHKKEVYYCREELSKKSLGTFSRGPTEAKTYCHLTK